jgi:hypothetical protein
VVKDVIKAIWVVPVLRCVHNGEVAGRGVSGSSGMGNMGG